MDNKPWYEKISIWIGIFAGLFGILVGIFTILGISIFGGKSLLDNKGDNITQEKEEKYHKGTITKTGWESKYLGLRYTVPDGMSMYTEEELDELMEFESETVSKTFSQSESGFIKLTTVYEMMSMTKDHSAVVEVSVEKSIGKGRVDVSQFVEVFESTLSRDYTRNYTLISDDETVKIGNGDYIKVSYIVESNNVFQYMDNYMRVVGDRGIVISLIYSDEETSDNILNAFTAY